MSASSVKPIRITNRLLAVLDAPGAFRQAFERAAGAHFMNHFGRFATEDIQPWRGTPPEIPWTHHR